MHTPSLAGEPGGPLALYRAKITAGALRPDPVQALVAERLQHLWWRLRDYDPTRSAGANGFLTKLWPWHGTEHGAQPQGLYLAGEVGRGKSMLMDMFYASVALERKRRVHFDQFMQDVRNALHEKANSGDPIPPLADEIAHASVLLCFDEFQINDIADAMLLGRLFEALFARGVIVVATSNTLPDDLFKDQPGRDAFLPFIEILKQHLDLVVLEGSRDFRRERLQRMPIWHVPADAKARAALDRAFLDLAGESGTPLALTVMGRSLVIPSAARSVARFDFASLCERPLGAPDYLALATHFETLLLDDIPTLAAEESDAARRFVTLIDALYDHRVKLIASAAAEPDQLYPEGKQAAAFRRTASRLIEMRTKEYLEAPHLT